MRATFFAEPYPVTTTVQVECLYRSDLTTEIAAIAEIPRAIPDALALRLNRQCGDIPRIGRRVDSRIACSQRGFPKAGDEWRRASRIGDAEAPFPPLPKSRPVLCPPDHLNEPGNALNPSIPATNRGPHQCFPGQSREAGQMHAVTAPA
ncbi:hypothetical protein [Burkholderia pseudomultivorans]|uniref:hypothetical protein n=1 Tax=Burkholderia pseudomultivorans TaxID=1207504 RepID=UPI000AC2FF36